VGSKSLTESVSNFKTKIMEFKHYIGIDVSKKTLDFALCIEGKVVQQYQSENSKKGIAKIIKQLRTEPSFQIKTTLFCMEHTGIYNNHLINYLLSCKAPIWIENALQIKQSQGMTRGKTDQIDAKRIAEYAFLFRSKIQLYVPPRKEIMQLKALLAMRNRIVSSIKELAVPIAENKGFVSQEIKVMEEKLMKATIARLEKTQLDIEKQINKIILEDKSLKNQFNLIQSVKGVGPIIAVNMIIATDEFKRFESASQFACYSGVVPFDHSSGTSIRGKSKVSHLANKSMKTLLHLAAMSAVHAKGELQDYYNRKLQEGKNKMSVINAIRNKIIHRIFAVVKRNSPYLNIYQNSLA
jgi:transposase